MSEVVVRIPTCHARQVAGAMRRVANEVPRGDHVARTLRATARQIENTLKDWNLPTYPHD